MKAERIKAFDVGEAVVFRIDQGYGEALNWEQAKEVVQHPTDGLKRDELVEVIAYLGAQLVGSRNSQDRDAALAVAQLKSILRDYDQRAKVREWGNRAHARNLLDITPDGATGTLRELVEARLAELSEEQA